MKINNKEYILTTEPQVSPQGRLFINTAVQKDTEHPDKWINKVLKSRWIYTFKYLDNNEYFYLYIDYNDEVLFLNKNV